MKRFLLSPTAFKGTLSPSQAALLIKKELKRKYPSAVSDVLPLADGGDGTLEVLHQARGGRLITTRVHGPLGKPVNASWLLQGKTAVIEMARASGLSLVKGKNKIMEATSRGTGELIRDALDKGCRSIFIGVGGTATADGGAGALEALGLRYSDSKGRALHSHPKDLLNLAAVDWSNFDSRLSKTNIIILCDVDNPLLGSRGSARVYGPQKGAGPSQVALIEKFLAHWSRFARWQTKERAGSGAAGALAYGLSAFAGAKLVKGMPVIMKATQWERHARRADVIITGEGKIDKTTFSGKVIGEIARKRRRSRVWIICGSSALSKNHLKRLGVDRIVAMGPAGLKHPKQALRKAAQSL